MLDNLKKEFEQNTDITFIDISLDKDSDRWRHFINKNNPKGIQLISMDESKTRALFEISGIPKHLIVNSKREFSEIYGSELAKIILIDSAMTNNYIHKKLEVTENKKTDQ